MNNLNTILNITLNYDSIYEINEEKLLLMKSEDYFSQSNLYFWLQNSLFYFTSNNDASAHIHYLLSYYLMVILTPICYEELAFNHINEAMKYSNNYIYKEWALIFSTLEKQYFPTYETIKMAENVLENNPNSQIANTILTLF